MLIGIDGRALCGPISGSGRYVSELCRVLDQALPHARFMVLSNRPVTMPVESPRWVLREDEDSAWGRRLSPFSWYLLRAGHLAARAGVDVFWGGANFLPIGLPRRIHAVLTVLDLVHRVAPKSMGFKHRAAFGLCFRASLRRADVVTSISEGTSARLGGFGYRRADLVVRPGVDARFRPVGAGAIRAMRASQGIAGPYLLSVSTLEPRKNLQALIAAFTTMRRAGELPGIALVLAGQTGWKTASLQAAVKSASQAGVEIVQTGHVPDELLPALYAGAEAVVMPSIYEGFGLPVLEARMCGARVVATDLPETREAGGSDVTYASPTPEGIRAAIKRALTSTRPAPSTEAPDVPRWNIEGLKLARALAADIPAGAA